MSFVNETRSDIFFLSVTALICFVLDHLLCPAFRDAVVPNACRHDGHTRPLEDAREGIERRDFLRSENDLAEFIVTNC